MFQGWNSASVPPLPILADPELHVQTTILVNGRADEGDEFVLKLVRQATFRPEPSWYSLLEAPPAGASATLLSSPCSSCSPCSPSC